MGNLNLQDKNFFLPNVFCHFVRRKAMTKIFQLDNYSFLFQAIWTRLQPCISFQDPPPTRPYLWRRIRPIEGCYYLRNGMGLVFKIQLTCPDSYYFFSYGRSANDHTVYKRKKILSVEWIYI